MRLVANTRDSYLLRLARLTHFDFTDVRTLLPRVGRILGLVGEQNGFWDHKTDTRVNVTTMLAQLIHSFLEKQATIATAYDDHRNLPMFGLTPNSKRRSVAGSGTGGHGMRKKRVHLLDESGRFEGVHIERQGTGW